MQLVEADFIGGRYNPYSAYLLQTHPFITQGEHSSEHALLYY